MAHDLAATRRARKGLRPGVNTADTRASAGDGGAPDGPGHAPVIGDRVVADVRHEIGNYFHKLYYWADFLTESRSGRAGDVTATQMLEDTVRGLEDLLRATLEYVRPIAATPIRMTAREVVDGVLRQLAGAFDGRLGHVGDGVPLGERVVLVDPGRLSQLLATIVRRLDVATDPAHGMHVSVGIDPHASGEAIVIRIVGVPVGGARSTVAEVEWATAENVARVLGGDLTAHEGDEIRIALAFPLRA